MAKKDFCGQICGQDQGRRNQLWQGTGKISERDRTGAGKDVMEFTARKGRRQSINLSMGKATGMQRKS